MGVGRTNAVTGRSSQTAFETILNDITYSGRMIPNMKLMDDKLYALLILETSGTLTVSNHSYTGDVWMCGGGGSGNTAGGGGGYTTNCNGVNIVSGSITIGARDPTSASQGGTTSAFGYSAAGGYGGKHSTNPSKGGCGGGGSNGIGQGTTTRPFGSNDMLPQCGGGGGPGNGNGYNGGSDGGDGTTLGTSAGGVCGGGGGGHSTYTTGYGGSNGSDGRFGYSGSTNIGGGFGYGGGGGGHTISDRGGFGAAGAVMIRIEL